MWTCPICKQEKTPIVLVPCGHSYCVECGSNCVECGLCRAKKEKIIASVELCTMLGVDIPTIEKPKDPKSQLETHFSEYKETGMDKINEIVANIIPHVEDSLKCGYFEQEHNISLDIFEQKLLEDTLTDLFKQYGIKIRVVNKITSCRIELTFQPNKEGQNPLGSLFNQISSMSQ